MYRRLAAAMKPPDGPELDVRMHFNETLRGLVVGAPVDFRGITIGNVKSINLDYEPDDADVSGRHHRDDLSAAARPHQRALLRRGPGAGQFHRRALFADRPWLSRAGAHRQSADPTAVYRDRRRAERQAGQTGLIEAAARDSDRAGQFRRAAKAADQIVAKLDKVPFEEIGNELRDTLHRARLLLGKLDNEIAPQARAVLEQAQNSLKRSIAVSPRIRRCSAARDTRSTRSHAPHNRCARSPTT